jgi:hypothetical protein
MFEWIIHKTLEPTGAWLAKYLKVYRVIGETKLEFLVFLGLNLFFGGLGLWLPPFLALIDSSNASDRYSKALDEGAGYIFALSFVTVAGTYLIKEYRFNQRSDFKDLKVMGGLLSLALLFFMGLVLTNQISSQILGSTKALTFGSHMLQSALTALGVVAASYLFCLEQIDQYPDVGADVKDRTRRQFRKAMDSASDPELRL